MFSYKLNILTKKIWPLVRKVPNYFYKAHIPYNDNSSYLKDKVSSKVFTCNNLFPNRRVEKVINS